VHELYQGAGCSNSQIELLTGIPGPPLDQIAAEYRACASTTELVKLHDSASNTAGSPKPGDRAPGRGHWTRMKPGRPENEAQ